MGRIRSWDESSLMEGLFSAGLYLGEQIITMVGFELLILVDVVTLISRCRALSGSTFFLEV